MFFLLDILYIWILLCSSTSRKKHPIRAICFTPTLRHLVADDVWTAVVQRAKSIERMQVQEAFGRQNVYMPVAIQQYAMPPVPALTSTQWLDLPRFICLRVLRLAVITRVGLQALAHAKCGLTELSVDLFSSGSEGNATAPIDIKADAAALAAVARRHGPTLRRLRLHLLTTDACKDFVDHCYNLLHLDHGDIHSTAHATHDELTYRCASRGMKQLPLCHQLVAMREMDPAQVPGRFPSYDAATVLACYAETIRAILRSCPMVMTCAGLFTQCTVRRRLINASMPMGCAHEGRRAMSTLYASENTDTCTVRRFFADQVFGHQTKFGDVWNLQYFYGFNLNRISNYNMNHDRLMVEN